jgi:hypothetical protein
MKFLLLFFAVTLSIAVADITPGKSLTQGNVTIFMTRYSNRPFPDAQSVPQVAPEYLREGAMVYVTSSNQATNAFKITIRYRDGDSLVSTTAFVERSDMLDAQGGVATFEIGSAAIASIKVEELTRQSSSDFSE